MGEIPDDTVRNRGKINNERNDQPTFAVADRAELGEATPSESAILKRFRNRVNELYLIWPIIVFIVNHDPTTYFEILTKCKVILP